MDEKAMVRTMFAEIQPFKRVENYFTNSLLYQETSKITKKPLPDDIDSGNQADFESEEDTLATFAMEPLVAYLDNPYCNNTVKNDDEWVLNKDVDFKYSLCFNDVPTQATYTCPYPHQ